jgi:Brp/Blh family beta-carotene 15,15'-monooxygenase
MTILSKIPFSQNESFASYASDGVLMLSLVFFGISHGSLDHRLLSQKPSSRFYLAYVGAIFAFLVLWFLMPVLAFLIFIFLSADHFGESQFLKVLKISQNQKLVRLFAFTWGLSISLIAPLYHWAETLPILEQILSMPLPFLATTVNIGNAAGLIALVSAWILSKYEFKTTSRFPPYVASTALLCAVLYELPLITGFITFFCFWHSWDSITHQRNTLNWNFKKYFKESLPLTAFSVFGLLFFVFCFRQSQNFWAYLFLMLGALTVPHAWVMKRFYKF